MRPERVSREEADYALDRFGFAPRAISRGHVIYMSGSMNTPLHLYFGNGDIDWDDFADALTANSINEEEFCQLLFEFRAKRKI